MRKPRTSRCSSWIWKRQRNQRSNCQHPLDHIKKQENSKKASASALTMLKPLTVWITTNCGKFFKRWEYQTTLSASCGTCMPVKMQQLELDMELDSWFKIRKGVFQGCILLPCLFNLYTEYIIWNAWLHETQARIKIARRNITSDMQMTPPLWQKGKRN